MAETGTGAPANIALVIVHDQPFAEGIAASSRYSKTKAATKAIQKLQGLSAGLYRARYHCDCREQNKVLDPQAMVVDDAAGPGVGLDEALGTAI